MGDLTAARKGDLTRRRATPHRGVRESTIVAVRIPSSILWLHRHETGRPWLAALPGLVEQLAWRWALTIGEPYRSAQVSYTAPATRANGEPVVLKVQWPHPECAHEAAALTAWNGHGAVRLIDHDPALHALLLEQAQPGTQLGEPGIGHGEQLAAYAGLLPDLLQPAGAAHPFATLAAAAAGWAAGLEASWSEAGRSLERRVLEAALDALAELPATAPHEHVLLHQDLHPGNVVCSARGWLAIDPKPLVGERAFALAPIIRAPELGHSRARVRERLDVLAEAVDVDRERARRWALAQTVAWGFSGDYAAMHQATASWLVDL